jgi:hypothetical protein
MSKNRSELPDTMIVNLTVTGDDIAEGTPSDATNCAIARAMKRAGFRNPDVMQHQMTFSLGGKIYVAALPYVAEVLVETYDTGTLRYPFYPIEIPLVAKMLRGYRF